MKRLLFSLLAAVLVLTPALVASGKAGTVVLHPGEVYYAHFQQKGKKLKLLGATKEKDASAQLIISLSARNKDGETVLKLESAFDDDLIYKAIIRSNILRRHTSLPVYPIVGGKMGTVNIPMFVDEIELYGFQFDPEPLVEKDKDQ
jgi:hypothetical protein